MKGFKIEKQESHIIRCEEVYVEIISDQISQMIERKDEPPVSRADILRDVVKFCKPIDKNLNIADLIDSSGNISDVSINWNGLLNHLYNKYGKDDELNIIPNLVLDKK